MYITVSLIRMKNNILIIIDDEAALYVYYFSCTKHHVTFLGCHFISPLHYDLIDLKRTSEAKYF